MKKSKEVKVIDSKYKFKCGCEITDKQGFKSLLACEEHSMEGNRPILTMVVGKHDE